MRKIKAAVVGCGMISNIYLVNLKNQFSVIDITACSDVIMDAARKKAEEFGIEKVMAYEEILRDSEIELIINLTIPTAHYDITKQALLAGKHVYSEKMLAVTIEQGKELLALTREKNLYAGVSPDTFLGAGLQTARYCLDAGMIGSPTSCRASVNRNHVLNSEFYGFIKMQGGGMAYDVGVYYVTALLSLMGPVKKITGFSGNLTKVKKGTQIGRNIGQEWELESPNQMAAALLFENGIPGTLHFDGESINEQQPEIVIYGTEGIMMLGDPNNYNGSVKILRKGASEFIEFPFTHGFDGRPAGRAPSPYDMMGQRGLGAVDMAWAIVNGRPARADISMACHTLEILCGIDIACESGKIYEMTTDFKKPEPLPKGNVGREGWLEVNQEVVFL